MFSASGLARHSQIITRIDTSGNEATKAPNAGCRLAISGTSATITPDINDLTIKNRIPSTEQSSRQPVRHPIGEAARDQRADADTGAHRCWVGASPPATVTRIS